MDGYITSLLCIILFTLPKMGISNMLTEFPLHVQNSLEAAFESLQMATENDATTGIGEEEFGRSKLLGHSISVDGQLGLEELSQCIESRDQTGVVDRWTECMELISSHAPTVALPDIPSTGEIKREYHADLREQNEKSEEQNVGFKELHVCSSGSAHSDYAHKFEEDEIISQMAEVDGESDGPKVRKVSDIDQFCNCLAELPSSKEETETEVSKAENSTFGKPENPLKIGMDGLRAEELVSVDTSKQLKLLEGKNINEEEFVKTKRFGNSISVTGQLNLEELSQCIEAGHKMSAVEHWTQCMNSPSSGIPMDGLPLFTEEISSTCVVKCEDSSKLPEQSEIGVETAVRLKGLQVSSAAFEHSEDTHDLEGQEIKSEMVEMSGEADALMGRNVSGIEEFIKTKQLDNSISVAGQLNLEELSQCIEAGRKMSSVERWTECMNLPSSRNPMDGLPLFTEEISSTCVEKCEDYSKLTEQNDRGEKTAVGLWGLQVSSADFEHSENTHELEGQEINSEMVEISGEADGVVDRNVSGIEEFNNVCAELPLLEEVEYEVVKMKNSTSGNPGIPLEVELGGLGTEESVSMDTSKQFKLLNGYAIFDCLLKNAKLVMLIVSSMLIMSRELIKETYKTLKMILLILTVAKQNSVLKITEVLGSREIKTSSGSPNAHERGKPISDSPNDHLLQSLGCLLGMAVASVVPEVTANNHKKEESTSADELARLMGLAVNESLSQVLGNGSKQFADGFEESFRSTFSTKELVKQVICDKEELTSSLQEQRAGDVANISAKDICFQNRERDCTKTSSSTGLHSSTARGCVHVNLDERRRLQENTSSSYTACDHRRQFVRNELSYLQRDFFNQSKFMNSDPQSSFKIREKSMNCRQKLRDDNCEVLHNKCAVSDGITVGNTLQKYFDDVKPEVKVKSEVNVPHENNHISHLGNGSKVGHVETEKNSLGVDNGVQAAKYSKIFAGNSSITATESAKTFMEAVGESNACYLSDQRHRDKETSLRLENSQQAELNEYPRYEVQSERLPRQFSGSITEATTLPLLLETNLPDPQYQQSLLRMLTFSVNEQRRSNHLKSLELVQKMRNLKLKEEQFQVSSQSNDLLRQNLDLSHSKAAFKENACIAEKLKKLHREFTTSCADELVAGTIFMLLALAYGARRHSHALLLEKVASCQVSTKTQKTAWFHNPMDTLAGHFQIAVCEVIVVSRMVSGGIFAVIASLILRRVATSSHQAMPTAIVLTVLGGFCGCAGKIFVDTLGGSGFHWLIYWEILCILHASASCFPSYLVGFLDGQTSAPTRGNLIPFWIRKFSFHAAMVLVFPVMAGLVPFASVGDWAKHFSNILMD